MSISIKKYKNKNNVIKWYANLKTWKDGGEKVEHLSEEKLSIFGIPSTLTFDEAKERIKQLNTQDKIKRQTEKKIAIASRIQAEREQQIAFLPTAVIEEFETKIIAPKFLGSSKMDHSHKTMVKWRAALRTMAELGIDPSDWAEQPFSFYNYFVKKKFSPVYVERIIAFLNLYGYFYCRKFGKAFLPIPKLAGKLKIKQLDAYHSKHKRGIKNDPLTPTKLESAKSSLIPNQYNWLYVSVWLGLRPSEIDACHNRESEHAFRITEEQGINVFHIYQPKLTGVEESSRWKMIPLIYPEQNLALNIVYRGDFKRPLTKTLQKYFTARTTTYAGRKGFTDLMLGLGQSLEDISQWLGHMSIERTWRNYKDKKVVRFKKPA